MKQYIVFIICLTFLSACISKKSLDAVLMEKNECQAILSECQKDYEIALEDLSDQLNDNQEMNQLIEDHKTELALQKEKINNLLYTNSVIEEQEKLLDSLVQVSVANQKSIIKKEADFLALKSNLKMIAIAIDPSLAQESITDEWLMSSIQMEEVAQSAQSNQWYASTASMKIDPVIGSQVQLNSGNIALYCPKKMVFKNTYDVMSILADVVSDDKIKDILIKQIRAHEPDITEEELNDNALIEKIEYYKLVKLELSAVSENSFEIISSHTSDTQEIKPNMEGWHWKVTPISEEPKLQLLLKTEILDIDGNRIDGFSKTFKVDVEVDMTKFFHKAKMLIIEEPKWSIVTLIIPFLSFLWGHISGKKKGKKLAA